MFAKIVVIPLLVRSSATAWDKPSNIIVTFVDGLLAPRGDLGQNRSRRGTASATLLNPGREHRLKMRALLFARNDADLDVPEPAFFQELMQLYFAESEPVICIQFPGAFEAVTQKIENHQSAAAF